MLVVEGLTKLMHFVQSNQRVLLKSSIRLSPFPTYFKIFQHFQITLKIKIYLNICYKYFEFHSNLISYPFSSCIGLIWDPGMLQACHSLRIFATTISSILNILTALWVCVPVCLCLCVCVYLHANPRINGIH